MTVVLAMALLATTARADEKKAPGPWDGWAFLAGSWEAAGKPEEGSGAFTFATELDGRILVRRNVTDLPASKDRPAQHHEDLLVVNPARDGGFAASYWDNEGHVLAYRAELAKDGKGATFVTDAAAPGPRFRLTYRLEDGGTLAIDFAIAPPGKPDEFKPYLHGTARRK